MNILSQAAARLLIVLIMVSVIATAIINSNSQRRLGIVTTIVTEQKNNCLSIAFSRIRDRLEEAAVGLTAGSAKIDIRAGVFSDTLTISAAGRRVSYFVGHGQNQGILIESSGDRQIPVCATVESFRCSLSPQDSLKIEMTVKATADPGSDKALNGRRFASLNFGLR